MLLGPVWMAPFLQVRFGDWSVVRTCLLFGQLTRPTWQQALMASTNIVAASDAQEQLSRIKAKVVFGSALAALPLSAKSQQNPMAYSMATQSRH